MRVVKIRYFFYQFVYKTWQHWRKKKPLSNKRFTFTRITLWLRFDFLQCVFCYLRNCCCCVCSSLLSFARVFKIFVNCIVLFIGVLVNYFVFIFTAWIKYWKFKWFTISWINQIVLRVYSLKYTVNFFVGVFIEYCAHFLHCDHFFIHDLWLHFVVEGKLKNIIISFQITVTDFNAEIILWDIGNSTPNTLSVSAWTSYLFDTWIPYVCHFYEIIHRWRVFFSFRTQNHQPHYIGSTFRMMYTNRMLFMNLRS